MIFKKITIYLLIILTLFLSLSISLGAETEDKGKGGILTTIQLIFSDVYLRYIIIIVSLIIIISLIIYCFYTKKEVAITIAGTKYGFGIQGNKDKNKEGSNNPPLQNPGIFAENIKSRKGGVLLEESGGGGIKAKKITAKDDVIMASSNSSQEVNKTPLINEKENSTPQKKKPKTGFK